MNIPLLIAHCSEAQFSPSPIQASARLRRFRAHGLIDALTTPPVQHISNPFGLEPLLHHKARKTSDSTHTVNNIVNPESVNLSPTHTPSVVPPRLTSRSAVQLPKIPRPSCPQSHKQRMLIARAPQNHKLNFKCKTTKTVAKRPRPLIFLKDLGKLSGGILSRRRITRLVRPPTDATTLRALSIEVLWLCVAAESQSSRGLLVRRSSIELGHRRAASSGAGTTTVTERSL